MTSVSPAQIRGARAMLGWSMADLSRFARVSVSTIKRLENGGTELVSPSTMSMIRDALEGVGIRFLSDEGSGAGLRMTSRGRKGGDADGARRAS